MPCAGTFEKLAKGRAYVIANLANTAAPALGADGGLNWAGFYADGWGAGAGALPGEDGLHPHSFGTGCLRHGGGSRGGPNWWKTAKISRGTYRLRQRLIEIVVPLYKDGALWGCWIWTALMLDGLGGSAGAGENGPNTDFL